MQYHLFPQPSCLTDLCNDSRHVSKTRGIPRSPQICKMKELCKKSEQLSAEVQRYRGTSYTSETSVLSEAKRQKCSSEKNILLGKKMSGALFFRATSTF